MQLQQQTEHPAAPTRKEPALRVRHLTTSFKTDMGVVTAVDDVSFDVYPGEVLGIVGESGCGKTVTSKSIMRLLPEHVTVFGKDSQVMFDGINLAHTDQRTMRTVRGERIAMIFQEPMTSLNPVFRIGWQIEEALRYHTNLNRHERRDKAIEMLRLVEIPNPDRRIRDYPHQLSGGMRQRVMIAIALCCEPDILIADEPTTALDVTIQAQILDLMNQLRERLNTAIVLITHDLGVIAQVADRVVVMYAGRVIEEAPVIDIFHRPRHPYTQALLKSIPKASTAHTHRLPTIPGVVPGLLELPEGCRFNNRCPYAEQKCIDIEPELMRPQGAVRCHFPLDDQGRPTGKTHENSHAPH